jgi:TRAP-type C4-dicarboxylate transport system permease small subunit
VNAGPASFAPQPPLPGLVGKADQALRVLNRIVMTLGGMALVAACCVLSYSVVVRYWLHLPTDWQDETAVFLIVGATFLSTASVQSRRGHVAIDAMATILPETWNRGRMILVDLASAVFCLFFSYKSWTLVQEAVADGQVSSSTWGPPLWIPYSLMASGMTMLTAQILLQLVVGIGSRRSWRERPAIGIAADPGFVGEGRAGEVR